MFKKIISVFLAFTMVFSGNSMMFAFGAEGGASQPKAEQARPIIWEGGYPMVGDQIFYLEVIGDKLSTLSSIEAEVFLKSSVGEYVDYTYIYNEEDFTKVASQLEMRYLGQNEGGMEHIIFKMAMDGDATLEREYYYIDIKDDKGNYLFAERRQYQNFLPEESIYPAVGGVNVAEIASTVDTLEVETTTYGYPLGLSANDFMVRLVKAEGMSWGGPIGAIVPVGEMKRATMLVDGIEDGNYAITGEINIYGDLQGGDKLFLSVSQGDSEPAYTMSAIKVLSGLEAAIGQFKIRNGVGKDSMPGGHGMESEGENGPAAFFADTDTNTIDFEFSATQITDISKLSVALTVGNTEIGSLASNSLNAVPGNNGVFTVTGSVNLSGVVPSGADGATLKTSYNGVLLNTTQIKLTELSGAKGLEYEGNNFPYTFSAGDHQLGTLDKIEITLTDSLNLEPGKLSAELIKGAEEVPLTIASQKSGADLKLTMTVTESVYGNYNLELYYNNERVPSFYFDSFENTLSSYGTLIDDVNTVSFHFSDDFEPTLKSIATEDDNLFIKGTGFKTGVDYQAKFLKRVGSSITAAPFTVSAAYQSPFELKLDEEALASLPRGWYTVYLMAGSEQIKGFADTSLRTAKEGPIVVLPTVKINNGASYTTVPEVTLNITEGTYNQVKFAETEAGLAAATWQSISPEISYVLSEGFGNKTLYFVFKAVGGPEYKVNASIEYRSATLADMLEFGVIGAKKTDEVWTLHQDTSYTFYIKGTNSSLTGKVEFLNAIDESLRMEDLKRTASSGDIHTYSKKVEIKSADEIVKKLRFYLKDSSNFTSKEEIMTVNVINEALITNSQTFFKETYSYQPYVLRGSQVQYKLWGTPNFTAKAILKYKDENGSAKQGEYALTGDGRGYYSLTQNLPADAAEILSIEYSVTDPSSETNKATKTEEKNRTVSGTLNFHGLKNETGDYNGKNLYLYSTNPDHYRQIIIDKNQTSFEVTGLLPAEEYNYSIMDGNKLYLQNKVALKAGNLENVDLSEADLPAKIKFNFTNELENASIYVSSQGFLKPGIEYSGFTKGQTVEYLVSLGIKDWKNYQIPAAKVITIDEKLQVENITLTPFEKLILSGTVTDAKIPDRKLEGVTVFASQWINNGDNYFYYDSNATTDANGHYELPLYKNVDVYLRVVKDGYNDEYLNITNVSSETRDVALTYSSQNKVAVNVFARPLVKQGEALDDSLILSLDNGQIKNIWATKPDGEYLSSYFNRITSALTFYGNVSNILARVFIEYYDMLPEQAYYEVQLDGNGNGAVTGVSVPRGVVQANVITGGDNTPTAYMLLFGEDGKQKAVLAGDGFISSEAVNLADGEYAAILLKGYQLDRVKDIKTLDTFDLLDLNNNLHYVKKYLAIEKGKLTDLGDVIIPELVSNDTFGFNSTSINTRFVPNAGNGEIHVLARFNPESVEPEATVLLKHIQVVSSAQVKENTIYYKGNVYKTTGFSVNDPGEDGLLSFTLVPSDMEQVNLAIYLTYSIDGKNHTEAFGVDNIDAPKVNIIPPKEVFMGQDAKEILVRGIGLPGSTIEIYDNGQLIGKTEIPNNKTNYQTYVSLINADIPMAHTLEAKMITADAKEYLSVPKTCEIIDPDLMAYTSNFTFTNWGMTFKNDSPKDSNLPAIVSYNPTARTSISFRINNLLKDQLKYVALVSSLSGEEKYFEATHIQDVEVEGSKYSEWQIEQTLGMLGDLSVYYALQDGELLAPISGSQPIDFVAAIEDIDLDPAKIPASLRDSVSNREIEKNTGAELDVTIPVEGGGYARVTGNFSEGHHVTEETLIAQGYRKFNTLQGYYWAKESFTNDGTNVEFHKSIYFSPELTSILKGTSYAQNVTPILKNNLTLASHPDVPLGTLGFADDTLGKVDYAGYVYGLGEFVNDTAPNPANFGKVGTGMQMVGGAVLAGQIISGPSSKDHNTLYEAAEKVENILIKSRLQEEIREYDRARRSSHKVSVLFGAVSYGASFAGVVGKGLSYIVSTGGMVYGEKTGVEMDIWWDSVMRDIQNELALQEARKNKKDKPPKPGKKDDQKKPKWKIDPSGYVFEAIDSNRVEGITATALVKNPLNEFVFWAEAEEWGEVNPGVSDEDGRYGWDVPPGDWKVRFEGDGYFNSETKGMAVPPAHDQVNIGLLATRSPKVLGVAMDNTGVEIEFDMFMQGESIYDKAKNIQNISVLDRDGALIPYKQVDFIIATEDTAYKADATYQTDIVLAKDFVKRVRFVVDQDLYPGGFKEYQDDGETRSSYQIVISDNIQSYAGVRMEGEYAASNVQVEERQQAAEPFVNVPAGQYGEEQRITVTSATEGATIYYTIDGSEPTNLSRVYQEPLAVQKTTTLKLLASKVGMNDSEVVTLRYIITKDLPNVVAKPIADIAGGTYNKAQNVTLSTLTEDAAIYYTIDGSIPSRNSIQYTGPILVSGTQVIKAIAVKAGYADSGIAEFSYTIQKDTPIIDNGGSSEEKVTVKEPTLDTEGDVTKLEFQSGTQGGIATAIIDQATAQKLIENAKNNQSELIVIVAKTSATLNKVNFEMPKTLMSEVMSKTKGRIKLSSSLGEITLDRKAIAALSELSGKDLSFSLEKAGEGILLSIQMDKKPIDALAGSILLTIPKSAATRTIVGVIINNDGSQTIIHKTALLDDKVVVRLNGTAKIKFIENRKTFNDVSGHWAKEAMDYVAARELFGGTAGETFSPDAAMTRGMLVTVLHRLEGKLQGKGESFKDVNPKEYYAEAVAWASSRGIVLGLGEGVFAPNQLITREQLAVIMYKYAKDLGLEVTTGSSSSIAGFSDKEIVSDWAETAMNYAVSRGLINGKDNGKLDPGDNATRAEVATILQRFMQNILF